MIYTASVGNNAPTFSNILKLYVKPGSVGCDVTYGKGAFWTNESRELVKLFPSDLQTGICLSNLPYKTSSMDFHVLDPPYSSGFFRPKRSQKALKNHGDFSNRYGNHGNTGYKGHYYHKAVEAIYRDGLIEADRVLRPGGIQITKVMDEVDSHKQHFTHCYVIEQANWMGFINLDLFVVVRTDKPHTRRITNQEHARKNHSFFIVLKKGKV